jgi:hypothetical protein
LRQRLQDAEIVGGSARKTIRSARLAPGALRNRSELGNLLLEGFATS